MRAEVMMSLTRAPRPTAGLWFLGWMLLLILAPQVSADDEIKVTTAELRQIKQAEAKRADTIERVYGSIVSIFGEVKNGKKKGGGSGVLFDESGFALTNHHVVAAAGAKGKAGLSDGKLYDWKLVGTDPAGDVAVIRLLGKDKWPIAPLGDSRTVRVGDSVMAMGNPFVLAEDYQPTVTMGIVSGIQRYQGGGMVYGNCIQVDSAINPGNSGGPLMNMRGEVIGINGRAAFAERGRVNVGVGFAISIEQIKNFIPELLAAKVAQHGTLDAQFGMRKGQVVCEAINLDGRAARAGLALGDRLLTFNGTTIETANQLANVVSMLPADWPARVTYEHNGKEFEFAIRLSALTEYQPPAAPIPELPESEEPVPEEREAEEPDEEPDQDEGEEPRGAGEEDDDEQDEDEDEEDEQGKDEQEDKGDRPRRRVRSRPRLPKLIPGAVLDEEENKRNALQLLARWQQLHLRGDEQLGPLTSKLNGVKFDVHSNGHFQIDLPDGPVLRDEDGLRRATEGDESGAESELDSLLDMDPVLAILAMAAREDESLVDLLGEPTLDGSDSVRGEPTFRLRFANVTNDPLLLWLTNEARPKLVQLGFDRNGTLARSVLALRDVRASGAFAVPKRFERVVGVRKTIRSTLRTEIPNHELEPTVTAGTADDLSVSEFAVASDYAQARMVKIYGAKVGQTPGYCSGVIVSEDGRILTANGTQLNGQRIRVVLPDGSSHLAQATKRSRAMQLALLKIDVATPEYFDLQKAAAQEVIKGQRVLALSNLFKIADGNDLFSVMMGVIALRTKLEAKRGNRPFPYEGDVLLLDCISSNPGAPGGAVVDAATGHLLGMIGPNLQSRSSGTKLNYSIPASVLDEFVRDEETNQVAKANKQSGSPFVGIRLFRLGGKKSPAYVDRVQRGSPAAKAKLRPDDMVSGIGDERIKTVEDYDDVFAKLTPGQEVEFAIKRGAKLLRVPMKIGAADK